jgi:hypothetical protein
MFEYPDRYFDMREDEKLSFLTATVAPWLLHFYVSWFRARKSGRIDVLWITYESFIQDNVAAMNSIEALLNIPLERRLKDVPGPENHDALRVNKRVAGRGLSSIGEEHQARIRDIMAFYPDVDFGPIAS